MALSRITIELQTQRAGEKIGNLLALLQHPRPALDDIGEYLITSTKQRFIKGESPDGEKWAPNSPVTLARKKDTRPLFGETKRLISEMIKFVSDADLEVGSNLVYAATQHFGASAGEFRLGDGAPVPWGDIPARPFLGLSVDDAQAVLDILQEHIDTAIA